MRSVVAHRRRFTLSSLSRWMPVSGCPRLERFDIPISNCAGRAERSSKARSCRARRRRKQGPAVWFHSHAGLARLSLCGLARFPQAESNHFVSPSHHVGIAGKCPWLWNVDLTKPMGTWSYKRSFETARKLAQVGCRFYDTRHTFVTRLAENPAVSEETIRQLAGHVSHKMLSRYAHIRTQARRAAISALEESQIREEESLQFSLQSAKNA
jgi:integrase